MIENIKVEGYKVAGPFSLAKKIDLGNSYLIYLSGVKPSRDENGNVVTDDVAEQTRLAFENVNKILKEAGANLDNVVKAVIYVTDMNNFDIISPIRGEYFKNSMPVSTMVEVNRMVLEGAKIEIEVTAILEK